MIKYLITFGLLILSIESYTQSKYKNDYYSIKYEKNGKIFIDTFQIDYSLTREEFIKKNNFDRIIFMTIISDTIFNDKGLPVKITLGEQFYGATNKKLEYNSNGFLFRVTGYDDNNKIQPFFGDIAIEEYDYDKNGNQIELRYLGTDRKLVRMELVGPAIIQTKYDKSNRKIEKIYFDEKRNMLTDFARTTFRYDSFGNLQEEITYNCKNEIVKTEKK